MKRSSASTPAAAQHAGSRRSGIRRSPNRLARPSSAVQDAVVALEQQHKRLQTDFFTAIRPRGGQRGAAGDDRELEASEAKNAALEARIVALEAAQAAAEKRESNKWSKMNPRRGRCLAAKRAAACRRRRRRRSARWARRCPSCTKVLEQQAYITELHDDLHHMADVYFHPIGGRPQGSAAVPDGLRHLQPPTSSANDAAAAPSAAATPAEGGGGDPLRRSNRPAVNTRESKLFDLEEKLVTFQAEVEEALAAAGIGGGSAGSLDNKLAVLEERIVKEVKGVAKEAGELKAGQSELQSARNKSENALSELSEHIAAQQVKLDLLASGKEGILVDRINAIDKSKASQHSFEQLTDVVRDLRTTSIASGGGGGGGGSDADGQLLQTLQAAQQSTQSHVLSLQTHLRALLRKAEAEKAVQQPAVDVGMLDDLKSQVHEALHELQVQVTSLESGKADADKVEVALESKADRRHVANKADRSFCESLLARFAVEVGKQLGDMEQNQITIKGSLEDAVTRLMHSSVDNASHLAMQQPAHVTSVHGLPGTSNPAPIPMGRPGSASRGGGNRGGGGGGGRDMSPEEQRLPDSPAEAPTTALSIKLDGMPTAEESFKEIGGGGGGGGGGQAQSQQQGLSGSFSVQKMRCAPQEAHGAAAVLVLRRPHAAAHAQAGQQAPRPGHCAQAPQRTA